MLKRILIEHIYINDAYGNWQASRQYTIKYSERQQQNKGSLKGGGGFFTTNKNFRRKGRRYCLPIMILYIHEKNYQICWNRFLENLLTN